MEGQKMERRIAPTSTFIKRYLAANNVSQKRLADLTGYTEKQVSLILNDKSPVTIRFATAMAEAIPGIKADFIIRYYNAYQEQLKKDKAFLDKNNYSNISKKYRFNNIFKHISSDPVEQTLLVFEAFDIDNLNSLPSALNNHSLFSIAAFSRDSSKLNDKDNNAVTIWTKVAMKQMMVGEDKKKFVGQEKTKNILKENKELLNVTDSDDLMVNIKYICDLCNIHVGFSKSAPTTYIKGLCFSLDSQLFIILTDRFKKIETTVFAFVHEMSHIIRGDISTDSECIRVIDDGDAVEDEADKEASEYIIPKVAFESFESAKDQLTLSDIFSIAQKAQCSIGLVVSKIQHDTNDYTKNWQYLNKFEIKTDVFDN